MRAHRARVLLAAGVSSVRDVGSYDDEAIALREAVRLGIVEGPRILSCGRITSATAPGGAIDGDPASDVRLLLDPQRISTVIQGGSVVADRPRTRELSAA